MSEVRKMKQSGIGRAIGKTLVYLLLLAVAFSILYPFYFMLINSLKEEAAYFADVFGLPRQAKWANYRIAWERFNILTCARNSMIVTLGAIFIQGLTSSMAAYSFAKLKFRGSAKVYGIIIACLMLPGQCLMVPVYQMMSKMRLINTYWSCILYFGATGIPFGTFVLTSQAKSIPDALLDAAEIDGASAPRTFFSVLLPLMRPAITTVAILGFLSCWNDLLYSMLLLQKNSVRTLTVEVATTVSKYSNNMPLLYTGLLLNCIPAVLVFIFFQKYISRGMVAGAIKS